MRISAAVATAPTLLLLSAPWTVHMEVVCQEDQPCVSGDFDLLVTDVTSCNFVVLLEAFRKNIFYDVVNVPLCSHSAEEELILLVLGGNNKSLSKTRENAEIEVSRICREAYDTYPSRVTFSELVHKYDDDFTRLFFKGGTDWNEQVETMYGYSSSYIQGGGGGGEQLNNKPSQILSEEVFPYFGTFFHTAGTRGMVQWPNIEAPELFDDNDSRNGETDPSTSCSTTNAAYCCWISDRQSNDASGHCFAPYDENCVDADPEPNTELCFVDHSPSSSNISTETNDFFFQFPFATASAGATASAKVHCHGFAWPDDENEPENVFKGNILAYVSMADHLYSRGFVRNIPGAPMCACAEKMPVVSRSDCSELEVMQTFKFVWNAGVLTTELVKIQISFDTCQGIDQFGDYQINDLWAKLHHLYLEGKVGGDKIRNLSQKIVGTGNCRVASKAHLARTTHKTVGYNNDNATWIQVAGRESLRSEISPEMEGFNALFDTSSNKIIRRLCATCGPYHQQIYYKRISPLPDNWNLLENLKNKRVAEVGQIYGIDFLLFSTYADAKDPDNTNVWTCNYEADKGFPGDCGPNGPTPYQDTQFYGESGSRNDVGFYVESEFYADIDILDVANIGESIGPEGSAFKLNEKIYLTGTGTDIHAQADGFIFYHNATTTSDVHLLVKIDKFHASYNTWAKAGLMIRQDLSPGSSYYAVVLLSSRTILVTYRHEVNGTSLARHYRMGSGTPHSPIWLKLFRRNDFFYSFTSLDGVSWQYLGNTVSLSIDNTFEFGLVVTSHFQPTPAEAVFSNYTMELCTANEKQHFSYANQSVPSSMVKSTDVGWHDPNFPGTTFFEGSSWILTAGGSGIWGTHDSFRFVSSEHSGNFTATVYLEYMNTTQDWAKAGIMIRESLSPKSKQVAMLLTGLHGSEMEIRQTFGGVSSSLGCCNWHSGERTLWLRLVKTGNQYTGFESPDGTGWRETASVVIDFDNSTTLQVGLVLTSTNTSEYATAVFFGFGVI